MNTPAPCTICLDPGCLFDLIEVGGHRADPLLGQLALCGRCRDAIATGWVMVEPYPSERVTQ